MPQGEEEASTQHRLRVVPRTPSPVLFSSDDQDEEVICCQGQCGAKDKPRGFAAEEPGGWMDSTMASLGDEGDQCITVGQLCPPTAFTVRIEVQGTPLEAVVDTGAEVSVLGKEVYNRLQEKPPSGGRRL